MSPRKRKTDEEVNPFLRMRVGIFEHLEKGWMDERMFTAYMIMIQKSNWATGVWHGSAAALTAAMGQQWSERTAERVIKDLIEAKYIVSKYQRGKRGNYDIWINNFIPTIGPNAEKKLRQVAAGFRNPLTGVKNVVTEEVSADKSADKSVAAYAKVTTELPTEVPTKAPTQLSGIQDVYKKGFPSVTPQDVNKKRGACLTDEPSQPKGFDLSNIE